jgi:hypothetical protein
MFRSKSTASERMFVTTTDLERRERMNHGVFSQALIADG